MKALRCTPNFDLGRCAWSYNNRVHAPWAKSAAVVFLCATVLAQSATPGSRAFGAGGSLSSDCPAARPVDDLIAQIHQQQSKMKHRHKNPLPEVICIFAFCIDVSKTPPTLPEPAPWAQLPKPESGSAADSSSAAGVLSSVAEDPCDVATRAALQAAHNVDVGDYYFEAKAYRAASLRYLEGLEEKPDDPAIHLRLGRVMEKLNQLPQAIAQYKLVPGRDGSERWSKEAKGALLRLERISDR